MLQAIQGAEPLPGILLPLILASHPWTALGLPTFRELGAAVSLTASRETPRHGCLRAQSLQTPNQKVSV